VGSRCSLLQFTLSAPVSPSSGIFFVIRPRGNLVVSTPDGKRLPVARYLSQQTGKVIDLSVRLGSIPALWLPARRLSLPVAPEVAEQRRVHLVEKAKHQGHTPSAEALALASWNLIVTNIAMTFLPAQEVLLLYRARGPGGVTVQTVEKSWTRG